MKNRLAHDTAWAVATSILELIQNCLREEEKADAFTEIYNRVLAGIEAMFIQQAREQQRVNPSRN